MPEETKDVIKTEEIQAKDHIGLVYYIAQELANTSELCIHAFGRDVSEYIGEGFLALEIAIKNFKPELGFKFSTYAGQVIRDRLIQAARRSSPIKISFQARYEAGKALQGKEIKPGNEQKVKDALRVMRGVLPISEFTETGFEDAIPYWETNEELSTRMEELDERTKQVLNMRYGLDGSQPLTLEEVGKRLNPPVTRERVRQIEKEGLNQLRELVNM
jgi:RNA polymerase primary sigma factor